MRILGVALAAVLLALAVYHIAAAFGLHVGQREILGGSPDPGPLPKLAVGALLLIGSTVVAARANVVRIALSEGAVRGMLYGMAVAFALVALDNILSSTRIEKAVFAPLAALLAVATLSVAVFPQRRRF